MNLHITTYTLKWILLLRFPSIKLYQLFPSDLLEQMRIKLAILKDLLNSESKYATVNVKNGKFCQYIV